MLKKFLYIAFLGLMATSCTEDTMDDINKNQANPPAEAVNAKFQITDAVVNTGFSSYGGAYAWYVSSYTEQTFGTGNNQLMKAELRMRGETAASTTFNNEWGSTYLNLENIRQILEKTEEGGTNEGQLDVRGIGQVLWVMNFGLLTDLHGDIPYSEALVTEQPKLDSQQSIYTDLLARIDEAISDLTAAANNGENHCGAQDVMFAGKPDKWLGLSYAVKARLLLNLSYRESARLAQAATAAQAALDAGFKGAELTFFNGVDQDNPWTAYSLSRYYVGANKTVVDLMEERNDPRLDIYADDYFGTGVAYAAPGDAELAKMTNTVGLPVWLDNGGAKLHVFSLSEVYFILAECKARAGQDATADLTAAVEASFADMEDAAWADLGSAADYVASLGAITVKEVMIQKYLAEIRDEQIQSYNDIRRCKAQHEEFVKLNNPCNTQGGQNQWPLRLPYGNSDVISNPNVAAAFGSGNEAGNYLFTENVWLFGGSR